MRTMAILATLTGIICGLHYTEMVNLGPVVNPLIKVGQKMDLIEGEPRYILVGVDVTKGREGELEKDREAITGIIQNISSGDRVAVYLIHSKAESDQGGCFFCCDA